MLQEIQTDTAVARVGDDVAAWIPEVQAESVEEPVESPETPIERQTAPAESAFQETRFRSSLVRHDLLRTFDARGLDSPDSELSSARLRTVEPIDEPLPTDQPPAVEDDFSQLGAAFRSRRATQILWNEETVNTVSADGLKQGQLTAEQAERNSQLAGEVLQSESSVQFSAGDLALIVNASGLSFSRQDPNQLRTAANYLNDANDAADQEERLRKTLDVFHTLDRSGVPQLTRDQIIGQLWVAARVPAHAIEKMNNAELARTYQDVAAVVNGPAGQQKLKVGKHEVTLTVNDANQVVNSTTKKPSVWGKIGKIALTVASFVPGPVGIAARIVSSVVSAAEGIKNKNWMQAVIGGASGIAASAGAIAGRAAATAGRAVSGAAATTARVADSVARGARAWQAGLQAVHAKNPAGIFNSLAGVGSAVAGAVGNSAETVARVARQVETWAGRAYVAAEMRNISRMGWQDQLWTIGRHGINMALDSGDLRPATSSFEVKWKLAINMGQTVRAGMNLQHAIKSGDVLLMSEAASEFSATSHHAYQNAAAARALMNSFTPQARKQTNTGSPDNISDLQFDGVWIGAGGTTALGPNGLPIPALPSGGLESYVTTVDVNGIRNTVAVQAGFMQPFADRSGTAVLGIHNSTQGLIKDVWQSLKDKLDIGRNPPVDTLAQYIYKQLQLDAPINLMGRSQGGIIISRALTDVRNRLRVEKGLSNKEVDSVLSTVTVTTFGGASMHYPNGPQYFHYINRGDYVAMPFGLGADLLSGVPLLDAGRGAKIIRFTDLSLPNPHDSKLYLNIYRRPSEFANGRNPYTPEEMKRYKIGH